LRWLQARAATAAAAAEGGTATARGRTADALRLAMSHGRPNVGLCVGGIQDRVRAGYPIDRETAENVRRAGVADLAVEHIRRDVVKLTEARLALGRMVD